MVFSLLSSALVTNGQEAFIAICPIIVKHWKIIAGRYLILPLKSAVICLTAVSMYTLFCVHG